jgi:hypothetical protein
LRAAQYGIASTGALWLINGAQLNQCEEIMEEQTRIIEINGVKLEVDMRTAKRIDTFRIGDAVKVLDTRYEEAKFCPGVIVNFTEFESMPSIEVMCLEDTYGGGIDIKFISIVAKKKCSYEIAHYSPYENMFGLENVVRKFNRLIEQKELELAEMKRKREYFINDFRAAFEKTAA